MKHIVYLFLAVTFFSCGEEGSSGFTETTTITVLAEDTALHLVNGTLFYGQRALTGVVKDKHPGGGLKSLQLFKAGKQDGYTETFYENGRPESKRLYRKGEIDGVHTGWWENGNKKYEYHFSKGNYNGLFTEWDQEGKVIQQVLYENGRKVPGK